jgi:hypothetical protein
MGRGGGGGEGERVTKGRGNMNQSIKFTSLDNYKKELKTTWINHILGTSQTVLSKTSNNIDHEH